jgi:hypothetical protein
MMVLALLATSAAAALAAGGREVLDDLQDNQRIDGCYTRAQYRDALRLVRKDQRLYAAAPDVIAEAEQVKRAGPDGGCLPPRTAPAAAIEDDSGGGTGIWIGLAVAVGVVAVGAGAWARLGARGGPGSDG